MILEIKVGSSLAYSYSSRHLFTCCCFWSFLKNQVHTSQPCGTCSNILLTSPGKLCNWSQQCLQAHGLFGDIFADEFSAIFCNFAIAWLHWTFAIFNWHSTGLKTWMSFKITVWLKDCSPKASRSITRVSVSRITELHTKIDADTLLNFAIHCRKNEKRSWKSTHVKNNANLQCSVTWQTDATGLQKSDFGLPSHLLSPKQIQQ
jgi:hypothetical protein